MIYQLDLWRGVRFGGLSQPNIGSRPGVVQAADAKVGQLDYSMGLVVGRAGRLG
jgi:hypothetical protein